MSKGSKRVLIEILIAIAPCNVFLTCFVLQALDRAKSDAEKLKKLVHGGSFKRLVCTSCK